MGQWFKRTVILFLAGWAITACGIAAADEAELRGQILVWHGWEGEEAVILDQLLAQFAAIYPGVIVIHESKPLAEIGAEFLDKAAFGMGPDLLIAPARWEPALAEAGVIQPVSEPAIDTSIYLPALIDPLRHQEKLYGLPLSGHTYALYYNKTLVDAPPATLAELLNQVTHDRRVALETTFYGAFWGIQAFGQQPDAQQRLVLDEKTVAAWLTWLTEAQTNPNIILSRDEELLYTLFREGQVAYYVGGSDRLLALQQALGQKAVGVAPLPGNAGHAAGPFLQAEVLMINAASTPAQTAVALELARFLTNEAQQTKLARQAGRIPANAQVKIDPRMFPAVAGFMAQTKTTVFFPSTLPFEEALLQGNRIYAQTLEGILEPAEAARALTEQFNHSLQIPSPGGGADVE
jgi:maltose-binding protein MalE